MNEATGERDSYINGEFITGPDRLGVTNPATGQDFTEISLADASMTESALAAARNAQPGWARHAPLERAAVMKRIADLIDANSETLAELIVREQGKPIAEARGETSGSAEFFRFFAEYARRIEGEILPSDHAGEQIWIQRVPIGVVAAIIPWNYPLALVARKVAPSMIAGNSIVLKSHENTPLSALAMARLFHHSGVPRGVVNIISGLGSVVGEAMCASDEVDLITMTGSVPTGKRIMRNAADRLTPVSLELGGKAPFIVMADADLDLAVRSAASSRYMNCGQVCICNERTFVERSVHDAFVARFIEVSKSLRIGDPMDESTDLGPKVSLAELEKVEKRVDAAVEAGAEILYGGGRTEGMKGGYYYNPTVIGGVTDAMSIMQDETFGPVIPIVPFDSFDDVVTSANNSRYGLSAYLFTNNLKQVMEAVNTVEFGELYINRIGPESLQGYHVGYRNSGPGGDDGTHGLETYLRKKTVYVNYSDGPTTGLMPYGKQDAGEAS